MSEKSQISDVNQMTMSCGQITSVLTKAVQEQQKIIEDLTKRIELLEKR